MIGTIYRKEILDLLRDRRTIISMVIVPLVVFPLLMVVVSRVVGSMMEKAETEAKSMSVAVKGPTPVILDALQKAGLKVVQQNDLKAAIEQKTSSAGLEQTEGPEGAAQITLYVDNSNPTSSAAGDKIRIALSEVKDDRVKAALRTSGVPESVLTPFTVKSVNVAPPKKMAGMMWGSMLGYLMILLMFTGGMYPVIDMTAGEKERRTLESLLVTPAGRSEIVVAKTLAAITAIFLTAMLTLGSIIVSVRANRSSGKSGEMRQMFSTIPLDAHSIMLIVLTLIPLCILAASAMMAIAVFARSFKEAQSYLTPVMLLVIFPALLGGLPALELTPALCLVPIFNASQLIRGILLGEFKLSSFVITLGANLIYAAVALIIARNRFEDETVLFRS